MLQAPAHLISLHFIAQSPSTLQFSHITVNKGRNFQITSKYVLPYSLNTASGCNIRPSYKMIGIWQLSEASVLLLVTQDFRVKPRTKKRQSVYFFLTVTHFFL